MKSRIVMALALSAVAGSASAREASVWLQCDGLARPETLGSLLGRVVIASSTFGLFGMPENNHFQSFARGEAGVHACTAALAELGATTQFWDRRAHLLKARAIHSVEAGDPDSALADLRSTHDVTAGHDQDVYFNRSLGLSIKLLEAAILAKRGQYDEAASLAVAASDARPYSLQVANLTVAILQLDPAWSAEKDRIFTRLLALTPTSRTNRATLRDWGGPADGAADDWRLVLAKERATHQPIVRAGVTITRSPDPIVLLMAALAAARAGRLGETHALLDELDGLSAQTLPSAGQPPAKGRDVEMLRSMLDMDATRFNADLALAKANVPFGRLYLTTLEGKRAEALEQFARNPQFPVRPQVGDMIDRLRAGQPAPSSSSLLQFDGATLIERARQQQRAISIARFDVARFAALLPDLDRADMMNSYSGQIGFGLKESGFKDHPTKDKLGRTIEFAGQTTTLTAVEEMALMRAAELTIQSGAKGFLVTDRRDFQQYQVMTYGGSEVSRTAAGYKAEADVVFVDPDAPPEALAAQKDRILHAEKVWTDLSPIYAKKAENK